MEVHFAPETTVQLEKLAASTGKPAAQVVEETISRVLQRRSEFIAGVDRGIEAADRGDFIDHEGVGFVQKIPKPQETRR